MSFCLFPIQLKWGGWTDDEVSFILKFCDSFCITARWSQDYFKLFWVEVLHYQSFFPGMIVPNWYYILDQASLVSLHGDVCVFHGLSWEAWHVLQWFIVFSYQNQCQVSRCSLKVIYLCKNFQHGLETTAF